MTRVMIAVDGSDLDREVAAEAHRLFGDGADYWAVNVQFFDGATSGAVPVPAMYGGALVGYGMAYPYLPPEPHRVDGGAGAESDAAQAVVDRAGLTDAEVVAEVGDPPTAILRAARDHGADVIVVGNHERGWWSKLLVSSVADDLLDESTVPVLVIKHTRRPSAEAEATA